MRCLFIALSLLYALSAAAQTKVAVLDTGLDFSDSRFQGKLCDSGHKSYGDASITDYIGHGTHVAGLIVRNAGNADYCLLIYKVFPAGRTDDNIIARAITAAVNSGAQIINMSFGGPQFNEAERQAILQNPQVTFIAAAGNDGKTSDGTLYRYYPADYNLRNIQVVGALGLNGFRLPISNYGANVKVWELGIVDSYMPYNSHKVQVGTSMAAAIRTGKLIKERSAK